MPEKVNLLKSIIAAVIVMISFLPVSAHEDDYIVGLSAFRDGLFEIAAPSLETYLEGETEKRKKDYSHYLLYRIYLQDEKFANSLQHLKEIDGVSDRRFDKTAMTRDKMFLLTKRDCEQALRFLKDTKDNTAINYFLDSECKPDREVAAHILENISDDGTRLKLVSEFSDDPELTASVFDSLSLENLNDSSKKYFALYFYKNGDLERFEKVRAVYEDAEIAGLELDRLWQQGSREAFIAGYEKYKEKYKLEGVNACRAIDVYKKNGTEFDCNIINECMKGYSIEFVQVKGACLVKKGNAEKVTEFVDSLKDTIFPGMCGYGEYIFHNGLYTGKAQEKFYQCEERYKYADVLMSKKQYQAVVNMFFKKNKDMDKFYAASALRGLGKIKAADAVADSINDEELKARYKGGA